MRVAGAPLRSRQCVAATQEGAIETTHTCTSAVTCIPLYMWAVYVVFGASGGIGSALSKRLLAQPGATVVVAGRDEGKLQQLTASLGGGE